MELKTITCRTFCNYLKKDPNLCYISLPDEALDYLYHTGYWKQSPGTKILGVYLEGELICCVRYARYTQVSADMHFYLATHLHKTGTLRKIQERLRAYFLEYEKWATKVFIFSPSSCLHVHQALISIGFKQEGCLTNCLIWRQKLVDILVFAQYVNKDQNT